jgi:hypothetical protein
VALNDGNPGMEHRNLLSFGFLLSITILSSLEICQRMNIYPGARLLING